MTRPGCGYCGLPRARVRVSSGQVVELPACRGHVDLLYIDPVSRFAGSIADELVPAELRAILVESLGLSSSSVKGAAIAEV